MIDVDVASLKMPSLMGKPVSANRRYGAIDDDGVVDATCYCCWSSDPKDWQLAVFTVMGATSIDRTRVAKSDW